MKAFLLVAIGAISAALTFGQGQVPIPSRELGFVYKNGQADAKIKLTAYIDATCPDSRRSFPTLLQVANHYKPSEVRLKVLLYSLPFHRHSHTISKAALVLDAYNASNGATVFDWLNTTYTFLELLSTSATVNQTDAEVLSFLTNLANDVSGIPASTFRAGVHDPNIDTAAILVWKYTCTRGVNFTPSMTLNDVFVPALPTWSVSQWTNIIDNLLKNTK